MDKRKSNVKIICPFCNKNFKEAEDLFMHVEKEHDDIIPEGITSGAHFLYYYRTKKLHGQCVMCKKPTEWNPVTNKYHRFCSNVKCKEKYIEEFKKRMIGKYGKTTLLNDPNHQRKMLSHRSISGTYKWSDGKELTYTGSYEKDALQFLDVLMNFDSSDVMSPSPHTYYYTYEGETKFYIPDIFIPSLNLEIEVKDGGDNINTHPKIQAVDKVKEKLKDDVMKSQRNVSYIKLVNKEYGPFFDFLNMSKDNFISGFEDKPIFITESMGDIKASCPHCGALIGYQDDWENSGICYKCGKNYKKSINENNDIVTESTVKSNNDIFINFDKWSKGTNNVLFVTGLSGSGKTTLSKEIGEEHDAIVFEMDLIYTLPNFLRDPSYKYSLTEGQKIIKYIFDKNNLWSSNLYDINTRNDLMKKCFEQLYKYTEDNPDKLFIFECIHIYCGYDFIEKTINAKNTPIVIKGSSVLKSTYQRIKRYYKSNLFSLLKDLSINSISNINRSFEDNIYDDKILQEFRKKYQSKHVMEQVVIGNKNEKSTEKEVKESIGCMAPIVAADEAPLEKDYYEESIENLSDCQLYIIISAPNTRLLRNKINILNATDNDTKIIVANSNDEFGTMLQRNGLNGRLQNISGQFNYHNKSNEYVEIKYIIHCKNDICDIVKNDIVKILESVDLIKFGFIQTIIIDSDEDKKRFICKLLGEDFIKTFPIEICI